MTILKLLEEKILSEGKALNKDILKVDSFINHQVDPVLMAQIGEAFAAHFKGRGITKVVTIESSGIAPALMTASALGVPMVILKKQPSQILNDNLYQTVITSFTKETNYELTLSKKYISEEDHVLIIDDFLANGRLRPERSVFCVWHMRPSPVSAFWWKSLSSPDAKS